MKILINAARVLKGRFLKAWAHALAVCFSFLIGNFAMAAGGLDNATAAANEWKAWLYGFLGVCVFLFMLYSVILALLNKQTWMDVLGDLAKVAAAGGTLIAASWAWSIWGT